MSEIPTRLQGFPISEQIMAKYVIMKNDRGECDVSFEVTIIRPDTAPPSRPVVPVTATRSGDFRKADSGAGCMERALIMAALWRKGNS